MAEMLQLPESRRNVARYPFPKLAPDDPGELRSCPNIAGPLPNSCRTKAPRAELRPQVADLDQLQHMANVLVDVDQLLPNHGPTRPSLVSGAGDDQHFGNSLLFPTYPAFSGTPALQIRGLLAQAFGGAGGAALVARCRRAVVLRSPLPTSQGVYSSDRDKLPPHTQDLPSGA